MRQPSETTPKEFFEDFLARRLSGYIQPPVVSKDESHFCQCVQSSEWGWNLDEWPRLSAQAPVAPISVVIEVAVVREADASFASPPMQRAISLYTEIHCSAGAQIKRVRIVIRSARSVAEARMRCNITAVKNENIVIAIIFKPVRRMAMHTPLCDIDTMICNNAGISGNLTCGDQPGDQNKSRGQKRMHFAFVCHFFAPLI
ncbi:MAG: hypothetical protein ACXIVE_06670 [Salinarimonas sp.]